MAKKQAKPIRPEVEHTANGALAHAFHFRNSKICKLCDELGLAEKNGDEGGLEYAAHILIEELRIGTADEWLQTAGRRIPENVEGLRALMAECGYPPEFITDGNWTPREVSPVLLRKLQQIGWSKPMAKTKIALELDVNVRTISRWVEDKKIVLEPVGGKFRYRLIGE